MYFHTLEHIYLAYFNDQIIVLDLIKNQYIILSTRLSNVLGLALKGEYVINNDNIIALVQSSENKISLPNHFYESLNFLQKTGILSNETYTMPNLRGIATNNTLAGISNIDWRINDNDLNIKVPKKIIIEAYFSLIKVYLILKLCGFNSLIKEIKNHKAKTKTYQKKSSSDFSMLATSLNRACFYFPIRTKCLEWSAALTFMGLKRSWYCNLQIGVQNLPLVAHAWVQAYDGVIADNSDLPDHLSVILSEPFERI